MSEESYEDEMNILSEIQNEGPVHSRLITLIEEITKRSLICYVTHFGHPAGSMQPEDDKVLETLLRSTDISKYNHKLDLMISSPGGIVEAADRLWQTLRAYSTDLRIVVPKSAMSAATLLSLGGDKILMGETSELGPIDPQFVIGNPPQMQPAAIVVSAFENLLDELDCTSPNSPKVAGLVNHLNKIDPLLVQRAKNAKEFSRELARKLLKNGLMKEQNEEQVNTIADKFIQHGEELSHGTSIRPALLQEWGFRTVEVVAKDTELWKLLWELFMRCDRAVSQPNIGKYFAARKGTLSLHSQIVNV